MKTPSIEVSTSAELLIIRDLVKLGVPANLKGYEYLKFGIAEALKNPDIIHAMVKEFYPCIAKAYDTTSSRVERAIRHAVEVAFDQINPDMIEEYFGRTISYRSGKPTNSEFVARVAECIRIKLGVYD